MRPPWAGAASPVAWKDAAEAGFEVRIWYVGLAGLELHLARIKARVKHGGHDIPEADVRRRFDQSRLQLIELLPHLSELRVRQQHRIKPAEGQAPQLQPVLHSKRSAPKAALEVLVPNSPQALARTPEWAKPIVMAAIKPQQARGQQSRPAKSP